MKNSNTSGIRKLPLYCHEEEKISNKKTTGMGDISSFFKIKNDELDLLYHINLNDLNEDLSCKLERVQHLCIRFIDGLRKFDQVSE